MIGYAVVDTETTGFSPRLGDRVVEVAVVLLDASGHAQDQWETLLDPGRGVGATHVHGITADDVAGAPRFADVAPHLVSLMAGRLIVGHNIAFDLRFLAAEFAGVGLRPPLTEHALCTQALAAQYLPGPKRTLAACCEQAGVTNTHAHSALGDTIATAELLGYYLIRCEHRPPWQSRLSAAAAAPWPAVTTRGPVPQRLRGQPSTNAGEELTLFDL